jgi:PIN domain nuclease of toxin-antitoxin system
MKQSKTAAVAAPTRPPEEKAEKKSTPSKEVAWQKWVRQNVLYVSPDVWGTAFSEQFHQEKTMADLKRLPRRVLLDTPTLDYLVRDPARLSHNALLILNDADTECLISVATWWEWAEKVREGQYMLRTDFGGFVTRLTRSFGLVTSDLTPQTLQEFTRLQPLNQVVEVGVPSKSVPATHLLSGENTYNRWLVAQALALEVPLLTPDLQFGAYKKNGLKTLW